MEFISAEEFLKQPKEVQKVFLEWWQPQMYDLSFKNYGNDKNKFMNGIYKGCIQDNETLRTVSNKELMYYPLLTGGQLRQFIEYKTEFPIQRINFYDDGYEIYTAYKTMDNYKDIWLHENLGTNLLQAYWKVALEIAKECVE